VPFRVAQDVNYKDFLLLSITEHQHRSNNEIATFVIEQGIHNLIIYVCRLYGCRLSQST
jgi:hypothetical protein